MNFKVLLINLDKSKERRAFCEAELNKYGIEFERISGVYGKDLSEQEVAAVYSEHDNQRAYKKTLGLGEIGCYLSHIKCWQKIVDEQLDYAVILEDDFKLDQQFQEFAEIIARLRNWDYCRLAFSSRHIPIAHRTTITTDYDLVYYKKVPINTLAQAVSLKGAKKLLAHSKKIYRPVDVDLKHQWEKGINIVGIDPPLIKERHDFESEIETVAKGKGRAAKTQIWKNLRYVLDYKIKLIWHSMFKPNLKHFIK